MSTMMPSYFRQSHHAQGIPAREPFSALKFPQRATEPRRLEQLPWPGNLFGELASIAELMAGSAHAGENAGGACSCGCRKEHKHNVSRTLWHPYGRGFDVICFRSEALQEQVEPEAEAETRL
jgi:hypothetical protein